MPFENSERYDFWDTKWKEVGAVYGILSNKGYVIYVGQTDNLKERMTAHRSDSDRRLQGYSPTWVVVEVIEDEASRLQRERQLINRFDPPCNKV
jgi:excinuclease UvrABC nuclease subunit